MQRLLRPFRSSGSSDLRVLVAQEPVTQGLPALISDAVALVRLAKRMKAISGEIAPSRERTGPALTEVGDDSTHAPSPR